MEALLAGTKGRLRELSAKHVESRVVQAMLRYADEYQRAEIATELIGATADLAKLPYARHVALALIRYCGNSHGKAIYEAVAPQAIKLASHSNGAKVLDFLLTQLDAHASTKKFAQKLRNRLQFNDFLQDKERSAIARERLLSKMADKALVHFGFCHDLLRAHTESCLESGYAFRLRTLASHFTEAALHCVASRNGAIGLCDLTLCADAKTRKKYAKALKSRVQICADHKHAYLVLWRLLDVTDDTVSMTKSLLPGCLAAALSPTSSPLRASRMLAFFLNPLIKLDQNEHRALNHRPETLDLGDSLYASKKASSTRYQEITQALAQLLSSSIKVRPAHILASRAAKPLLCAAAASSQLDNEATQAIAAAATSAYFLVNKKVEEEDEEDSNLAENELFPEDEEDSDFDEAAFEAKLDSKPDLPDEDEEEEELVEELAPEPDPNAAPRGQAILEHDIGHATLKAILQHEAKAQNSAPIARAFYDRVQGSIADWVQTNRGALVIEALLRYESNHDFVAKLSTELSAITLNTEKNPGALALAKKFKEGTTVASTSKSKKKRLISAATAHQSKNSIASRDGVAQDTAALFSSDSSSKKKNKKKKKEY
uniref:PUM-HD domain-containing protein n=1 Tax=Aureoumbra lagunensis TaxID=44058 RepID=A0A7S3JVL3_9STRA